MRRTLVTATDPVSGLLARVRDDDLIVIGFAQRDVFEKWLFSRFSERLLDNAPGPVILTSAHVDEQNGLSRRIQRRIQLGAADTDRTGAGYAGVDGDRDGDAEPRLLRAGDRSPR